MKLYRSKITEYVMSASELNTIKNAMNLDFVEDAFYEITNPSVIDILKCDEQYPGTGRKKLAAAFYMTIHPDVSYKAARKMVSLIVKDMKRFNNQ